MCCGIRLGWTLGVVLAFLTAPAAARPVLLEDNFNHETGQPHTVLNNWTVSNGTIDVIGRGLCCDVYPGHGRYVDLDGSTNNAGRIETAQLTLTPGKTYKIRFLMGVNNVQSATLTCGGGKAKFTQVIPAGGISPDLVVVKSTFVATQSSASVLCRSGR